MERSAARNYVPGPTMAKGPPSLPSRPGELDRLKLYRQTAQYPVPNLPTTSSAREAASTTHTPLMPVCLFPSQPCANPASSQTPIATHFLLRQQPNNYPNNASCVASDIVVSMTTTSTVYRSHNYTLEGCPTKLYVRPRVPSRTIVERQ